MIIFLTPHIIDYITEADNSNSIYKTLNSRGQLFKKLVMNTRNLDETFTTSA